MASNAAFAVLSSVAAGVGLSTGKTNILIGSMLLSPIGGDIVKLSRERADTKRFWKIMAISLMSCAIAVAVGVALPMKPSETFTQSIDFRLVFLMATVAAFALPWSAGSPVREAGIGMTTALIVPLVHAGMSLSAGDGRSVKAAAYMFVINYVLVLGVASAANRTEYPAVSER